MSKQPTSKFESLNSEEQNIPSVSQSTTKHGQNNDASQNASSLQQEVYVRKKKRRNLKRKKRIRIALIVLGIILFLILAIGGSIFFAIQSGKAALHQDATDIQVSEEADSSDAGNTVYYNGHTYQRNENIISLCIMGYDRDADTGAGQAGQADALMVLALDTETGKTTCIGIPRDSMVEVDKYAGDSYLGQETMQICLAFGYGDGEGKSAQITTDAVSRVLYNMPMSYYFAMNMQGIVELNDAIGGVSLVPVQTVPGTGIVKGESIFLYGNNALKYVQWRDTSVEGSSLDRQERQIQYIQAFFSQALDLAQGNVGVLVDLYNTLGDYSVTNLGVNEFSYLASVVLNKNISSIDVVTLPGELDSEGTYAEYNLDKTGVYETVLDVYYNQVD